MSLCPEHWTEYTSRRMVFECTFEANCCIAQVLTVRNLFCKVA